MSVSNSVNWSPTTEGITLSWSEVSVYASCPNRSIFSKSTAARFTRIINNVTGAVKAGTLVALMGPSGAGKSSLMGALAHRNSKGVFLEGDIRINGLPIGSYVHKISGFMDQQDLFVDTLTVREHLQFMAKLKLPRSKRQKDIDAITEDYLVRLSLLCCADNRIGGYGTDKVLSGGEKKRLAFATEMLTNPQLLFCDEPTTGLDSYSAQTLVNIMKTMALEGKTIVCTIHQPSSEIFDLFNQLILLTEGRIAFMGDVKSALAFFEEHGYHCPSSYNPAEFFIKCLAVRPGCETTSKSKIKQLCDQFTVSQQAKKVEELVEYEMKHRTANMGHLQIQNGKEPSRRKRHNENKRKVVKILKKKISGHWRKGLLTGILPSASFEAGIKKKEALWLTKLFLLTSRSFLQVLRDPSVQAVRIIQKLALALMAGLCYVGTVLPNQTGVQSVQGAVFIFVTENTFGAMYSVLAMFPTERPLFMREFKNGLYSPQLYYLSKVISLLPGLILEPVTFTLVAYWLVGLRSTFYAFTMTAFITILTMNVATAVGCFFSNAFSSLSIAMACLIPFDYVLMITSGLFIKLDSMPDAIGWFKYISFFMYSNEAMSILQWDGVQNITCEYANPDLPCLRSGVEVLEKYDFSVSHFERNISAMFSMWFVFHILGFICLYWRAKANK